jgi:hypothetical protein
VVVVELFEYNVSIKRADASCLKSTQNCILGEGRVPGTPEQLKEVAFFD